MKHIKYWLRKEVSKIYEKIQIRDMPPENANIKCEKFMNENRKRIQDLELVVKEIVYKVNQVKHALNNSERL